MAGIPLKIRVYAEGGDKRRGYDYFRIAVRVKNTGNLDISGWSVYMGAQRPDGNAYQIAWVDLNLAKGVEKRLPESGYYQLSIPSDAPTGIYKALALVIDAPPNQTGNVKAKLEKDNAWNVYDIAGQITRIAGGRFFYPKEYVYGTVYFKNTGNITTKYKVKVVIYDSGGKVVASREEERWLDPGVEDNVATSGYAPYTASITVLGALMYAPTGEVLDVKSQSFSTLW